MASGEKVLEWFDPNDEPTTTYAGNYIRAIRSDWLGWHLHKPLTECNEKAGMHPTRSLEAVSHLALREKLSKFIFKKRILSYKAASEPVRGQISPKNERQQLHAPIAGKCVTRFGVFTFTG